MSVGLAQFCMRNTIRLIRLTILGYFNLKKRKFVGSSGLALVPPTSKYS